MNGGCAKCIPASHPVMAGTGFFPKRHESGKKKKKKHSSLNKSKACGMVCYGLMRPKLYGLNQRSFVIFPSRLDGKNQYKKSLANVYIKCLKDLNGSGTDDAVNYQVILVLYVCMQMNNISGSRVTVEPLIGTCLSV